MNQPQLITKISIRGGLEKAGLRKEVPGKTLLLKPKVFLQLPQIQRLTLPFQEPQILSTQRVV